MTQKQTIEKYMQGFREGDHAKILSCLAEDIVWEMPGVHRKVGHFEFDREIENENFTGRPSIAIKGMIEEGSIVVAEGTVTGQYKNGAIFNAMFCDVSEFRNALVSKLTTYLMMLPSIRNN